MNAELIRMRKKQNLKVQTDDELQKIENDYLSNRIIAQNTNMVKLMDLNNNPNATINDYLKNIVKAIYLVLQTFNDMGIYPDYFYDIYFKINEEFRNLASQGILNGRIDLYDTPGYEAKISYMMERGITTGNYKFNPTRVKDIGEYYNEMVDYCRRFYLPNEVMTIDMCREMSTSIWHECNKCINALGIKPYISDDVEYLSRLLFEYMKFFAAIGIKPKFELAKCVENPEEYMNDHNKTETGKSK